jgi:polysaccharide deacetylase family protein (PEP-CTERM system associated)
LPSRVDVGVGQLLDLLARYNATGTFFVLGWLADRHPSVVRDIAAAGHEIASHGWAHERVTHICPDRFRQDIRDARQALEDVSGAPVIGYRAPSFSITRANDWALDIIVEEGYRYDSSLFPIVRSGYGYVGGNPDVHWITRPSGRLLELPPATLTVGGVRLPAAGGAYFRLLPLTLVRSAFRAYDRRAARGTFYLHPWELDTHQPRMAVPWWTRIRHYGGIARADARLQSLLAEFRFTAIGSCAELQ